MARELTQWDFQKDQFGRNWFRGKRGREEVTRRSEMWVRAANLEHAAMRAKQVADDDHGGFIELLQVRQAAYAEAERLEREAAQAPAGKQPQGCVAVDKSKPARVAAQ